MILLTGIGTVLSGRRDAWRGSSRGTSRRRCRSHEVRTCPGRCRPARRGARPRGGTTSSRSWVAPSPGLAVPQCRRCHRPSVYSSTPVTVALIVENGPVAFSDRATRLSAREVYVFVVLIQEEEAVLRPVLELSADIHEYVELVERPLRSSWKGIACFSAYCTVLPGVQLLDTVSQPLRPTDAGSAVPLSAESPVPVTLRAAPPRGRRPLQGPQIVLAWSVPIRRAGPFSYRLGLDLAEQRAPRPSFRPRWSPVIPNPHISAFSCLDRARRHRVRPICPPCGRCARDGLPELADDRLSGGIRQPSFRATSPPEIGWTSLISTPRPSARRGGSRRPSRRSLLLGGATWLRAARDADHADPLRVARLCAQDRDPDDARLRRLDNNRHRCRSSWS